MRWYFKKIISYFGLAIPLYKFYIDKKLLGVECVIPYVGLMVLVGAIGYYSIALGYDKVVLRIS